MAAAVPLVFNEALNVSSFTCLCWFERSSLWLPMDPAVGFYVGSSTAQRISADFLCPREREEGLTMARFLASNLDVVS